MEIKKKFKFVGTFSKANEGDTNPIEISDATIVCYVNGEVCIELDYEVNQKINDKINLESVPKYNLINTNKNIVSSQEIWNLMFNLNNYEKELIQPAYEGDYKIEGWTTECWRITANFYVYSSYKSLINNSKEFCKLRELRIDYNPSIPTGKVIEIKYGLSNIHLLKSFLTSFLDSKAELFVNLVANQNDDKQGEVLSAELILKGIEENENESYELYYAWFKLLFSFASGKNVKQIYRIEKIIYEQLTKEIEYWNGDKKIDHRSGMMVIQMPHIHLFIQKCSSQVNWKNFADNGLGLALSWYISTFDTNQVSIELMILCTVLETLNKKYTSTHNSSKKLIDTKTYRRIRDKIITLLKEELDDLTLNGSDTEKIEKYIIFHKKVAQPFENGSYNQVGNLRTSLSEMLDFYQVPYRDLFPNLEFIKIRDKVVHEGFGGIDAAPDLRKLSNLVIRLFLSMLKYEGDYMESVQIDIQDESGITRHRPICRSFPFQT